MQNNKKALIIKVVFNIMKYALCLLWFVPVLWMAAVTFKPEEANVLSILSWVTPHFTLENIQNVLNHPQADVFL